MGKLDKYTIDLKGMETDSAKYEYTLDSFYFEEIDAPEIHKGHVKAELDVRKTAGAFELTFHLKGEVCVPCDRCLDDMELHVQTDDRLVVKLGRTYSEEDDELVVVPEEEGTVNVAWFMYEFIALAIPMKHVHEPGQCNKEMADKLKHLQVGSADEIGDFEDTESEACDEEERPIDPRWNELKKIIDNN